MFSVLDLGAGLAPCLLRTLTPMGVAAGYSTWNKKSVSGAIKAHVVYLPTLLAIQLFAEPRPTISNLYTFEYFMSEMAVYLAPEIALCILCAMKFEQGVVSSLLVTHRILDVSRLSIW
jgi:hypothetical protein